MDIQTKDVEKVVQSVKQLERTTSDDSVTLNDARLNVLTPAEQKKLLRRIDVRLLLCLGALYCVSLMDRTNTGIAVVAGMGVDLKLDSTRYSLIVLTFFFPYILLQPLGTVMIRKVGPRVFLPTITFLWGAVMISFGFIKDWKDMIGLRVLLGILEAGFFPGSAYLLSTWFTRYELQKRYSIFYVIGSMSSAFSGILAYGFYHMNTLGDLGPDYGQHYGPTKAHPNTPKGIMPGIAGWRWIFIMQGVLTCVIAAVAAVAIADFPDRCTTGSRSLALPFLTQKEADFVVARIEQDRSDAIPEPFKLGNYLRCALDLKVWGFAALFGLTTTMTYSLAYFLPIVLSDGLGFDLAMSECMIAPPYVAAAIWMYACAWIGDKYRIRGPLIIVNAVIGLIGIPILGFVTSPAARYVGACLTAISCNANIPAIMSFQANNIRGQWKRALCSATMVGVGGLGGIIGGTVFRSKDAPSYRPGIITAMTATGLVVLITAALDLKFWRANRRAAAGGKIIEGLEGFRYTL